MVCEGLGCGFRVVCCVLCVVVTGIEGTLGDTAQSRGRKKHEWENERFSMKCVLGGVFWVVCCVLGLWVCGL